MKRIAVGLLVGMLLLLLVGSSAWAGPSPSGHVVYVVRWGDNLSSIARWYGTTVQAIVVANNLANPNRIYAGQRLIIPQGGTPSPAPPSSGCSYVVRPGDTVSGIAYRHGVSTNAIVRANNLLNPNRIYAGQRLVIPCGAPAPDHPWAPPTPAPGGVYYVVRGGDTLAKIAMRFGVNMWSIVRANNIANPNVIIVGQRLYIPKASAPQPAPDTGWVKPGCEHLAWPKQGVRLSGTVQARGTADLEKFGYYKLEFRKDGLDGWHYVTGADTPVVNGALGDWDTRTVSDGGYTFRLVVVDQWGNYPPPCEITVYVRNDP